jgi:hypothetical protein
MLRYLDATSATIWLETDRACSVTCLGRETRTFAVHGRHYALVMIEELEPGSSSPYTIELDGREAWPARDGVFPTCSIRTPSEGDRVRMLIGSCRAAAPHEPPFDQELTLHHEGRGVDTLWAHARRMLDVDPSEWPDLLLLLGDQIYADDSSPTTKERIERCRSSDDVLPPEIVADFEEYCWLYHEAWSKPVERWLFSTVSSAMIFDDHDNIDDWNISASWVEEMRGEPWWEQHSLGGIMSYWIHQHLGNLSPRRIREEGLLAELVAADDGTERLEAWAREVLAATPLPGGYRFSFTRQLGDLTIVVVDCRNARVLDGDQRLMVGPEEWQWVTETASATTGHLILATSVPVFIPDGLHDLQVWNEAVCGGSWGRWATGVGERIRRGLDLEDWSAFSTSYRQFTALVAELGSADRPLRSIVVASGDIHFSYAARLPTATGTPVWQLVSSPIRNALIPPERGILRFTLTGVGRRIGSVLRRSVRAADTRPSIEMIAGPFFNNNMCELVADGASLVLTIEQATSSDDGPLLTEVACLDLLHDHRDMAEEVR